jgi:hypothetical protein
MQPSRLTSRHREKRACSSSRVRVVMAEARNCRGPSTELRDRLERRRNTLRRGGGRVASKRKEKRGRRVRTYENYSS